MSKDKSTPCPPFTCLNEHKDLWLPIGVSRLLDFHYYPKIKENQPTQHKPEMHNFLNISYEISRIVSGSICQLFSLEECWTKRPGSCEYTPRNNSISPRISRDRGHALIKDMSDRQPSSTLSTIHSICQIAAHSHSLSLSSI